MAGPTGADGVHSALLAKGASNAIVQVAKAAAQASLEDRLVQQVEQEVATRRDALEVQREDTAAFASSVEYDAATARLNDTAARLLDNVRVRRHHAACQLDLEPFNQPGRAQIPVDAFWDAAVSPGAGPGLEDNMSIAPILARPCMQRSSPRFRRHPGVLQALLLWSR